MFLFPQLVLRSWRKYYFILQIFIIYNYIIWCFTLNEFFFILTELFLLFQRSHFNNIYIHYVYFTKRDTNGDLIRITAYEELKFTINTSIFAAIAILCVPLAAQNTELVLIFNQQLVISHYTQWAKIYLIINSHYSYLSHIHLYQRFDLLGRAYTINHYLL